MPDSPYQPILIANPNDWSLSLNYTSGGGLTASSAVGSFAIDATGNLWITDSTAGSVIEWNAVGVALSPSTGYPAGGNLVAVDANNNVWIAGNGVLNELTNLGSPLPWSPYGGVQGGGSDFAIDAQNNLWITGSGGVHEFNNLGVQLSPINGFINDSVTNIVAVGIDSSDNAWVGNTNPTNPTTGYYAELSNPGGQLIVNTAGGSGSAGTIAPQIAADGAGNLWSAITSAGTAGGLCHVSPYVGQTNETSCSQSSAVTNGGSSPAFYGLL